MEEVTRFDNLGKILIMGDMNSRVGTEDDFIRDDEIHENLPLPEYYLSDQIIKDRTSLDKLSGVQGHEKNLLNFCKSTGFRIMNGRWEEGEEIGKFTCFKPTGNSLVDYCLYNIREKDSCIIKSFRTGDISIHSDHAFLFISPVLFSLFLNDLQGYLLEGGANGITLWDIKNLLVVIC